MKKIISVILLLSLFLLTAAGCDTSSSESDPTEVGTDSTENAGTEKETQKETQKATDKNKDEEKEEMLKPEGDGILKILTIGNSFSDDTMEYVYKIAKSAGVKNIKLGNLYIGGCSLNTHVTNAKENKPAYDYRTNSADAWRNTPSYRMKDAIESENWDYISLQQASGSSGIEDTYSNLQFMIDYVKELAPDAKLVWNMTWAYQQNASHADFPKYDNSQIKMYESILNAVENKVLSNEAIYKVVSNGTAIQNARTSYVGDTLTRDGFHLSLDLGRYIAGLTFFCTVTEISVEDVTYAPDGVDEELRKVATESAINAIVYPFEITNSRHTEKPTFDDSNYELLDLGLTMLGYWNSSTGQGIDTITSNHVNFVASRLFTKEDIPVGSVIVLADGWRYRPEAWKNVGAQSSRPSNVTASTVVISEAWWADYTHRAFNISKTDGSSLENLTADDINAAFKIYIPKK